VPPIKLQTAQPSAARTLDLGDLVITGDRGVKANLSRATTSAVHENTIEGAGTVTIVVRDPGRGLLRSYIVKTKATLMLDAVRYVLVRVAREGNQLTLIFEEAAVNILRQYDSPKKANRDNTSRAAFVESLVREPKEYTIPFWCPERNAKQPIAGPGT
jgi:hypothetical protein